MATRDGVRDEDYVTSLEGPVERVDGQLVLRIPLDAGGDDLHDVARGISRIDGDCLEVRIPDWLAEKLGIWGGTIVAVDNRNGKFNITPAAEWDN